MNPITKTRYLHLTILFVSTLCPLAVHSQDADSEDKKMTVIATKLEDIPERCRRIFKQVIKGLPDGWKIQVTFGEYYDFGHSSSSNKFEPYIQSAVPLDTKDQPHGEEQFFLADGRLTRTVPYENGTMEGTEKIFRASPGGKYFLYAENSWLKGEREGLQKTYHENEQVSSETLYKKGEAEGKARSFDREGKVIRECEMKDGKPNGVLTDFWPETGKPRRVISYKKGQVQGIVKEFYSDGKMKREVPFKKGSMHGEEKEYEGDGTLARTRYWLNGNLVSKDEFSKKY
ncbi:MAG: toxin-antitoxin system YwqK family antitoxin [Planctomycetota bacterium]|nr:toxin-antitoxin system YwqK family antitoxin [Planctomycetota bacterium]MDA1138418.1 toxin-antitoxin system YwqK family antitoxin [Planctomycetota bacterium]